MQKTEKIAHHVRKEANLMNLSQYDSMSSDGKVDEITRRLLSKYKEYEAYPGDKFKSYVKDALNETDGNQKVHRIVLCMFKDTLLAMKGP